MASTQGVRHGSICGRQITGYVKHKRGRYWLTTWGSGTTSDGRSEVVERFWNNGLALMFRLSRGRFIVGLALGDGMLFRGELIDGCSEDDARRHCQMVAENWAEVDQMEAEEAALEAV